VTHNEHRDTITDADQNLSVEIDKSVEMSSAGASSDDVSSDEMAPETELSLTLRAMSSTAVVLGATLILLSIVHPNLILRDTTPTGGDMGAHVWGPAFLRDVLLPQWQLTGWSMDWYAGLPTYRFYMVIPALAIVLLDVFMPYGIAFKIIAVIGILAMPLCAWLMGRWAKLAYPIPELLTIAVTVFMLDESFTIYGGNIASTMAGEFSFTMAMAFALLTFGLFARGLEDGKYRGWAAVTLALSALSHGIVLMFVFGGVVVMLLLRFDRQRLKYASTTIICAVLLSAFWVVPFLGGHAFMTDMKYEPRPSGMNDSFWDMYFPLPTAFDVIIVVLAIAGFIGSYVNRRFFGMWLGVYCIILMIAVKLAQNSLPVIGLLWNPRVLPFVYITRYMLAAIGFYEVARYLYRTAQHKKPLHSYVQTSILWIGVVAILIVFGFRYQNLPGGSLVVENGKSKYAWGPISVPATRAFSDGWARWNFTGYEGKSAYGEYYNVVQAMKQIGEDPQHGCGRALWENNEALGKYGTTMALMLLPFWTDGCIASMEGLYFEAAGTTPYHFIAAAAVSKQSSNPVRELRYDNNKGELGVEYMRQLGVKYLMVFTPEAIAEAEQQTSLRRITTSGPWHIFEHTDNAIVVPLDMQPVVVNKRSGDQRERWLEIGTSYFQRVNEWPALPVADGPREWQRIDVVPDVSRRIGQPGDSGRRVDIVVANSQTEIIPRAIDPVRVSDVVIGRESVSFSVDQIGVPVLVRVSYFPNWTAHGTAEIVRAAPNMMVVIPRSSQVRMSYEPSVLDRTSYLMTFGGVAMVAWFSRRRFRYGTSWSGLRLDHDV
jgi:hypothetical protein